ncbi:MAG: hypothetical protein GF364_12910 [Candidatus Lokiarchaeota archaeon]|nr:hypothetical protein [Candidatus Lokiarchaeota archaeon]
MSQLEECKLKNIKNPLAVLEERLNSAAQFCSAYIKKYDEIKLWEIFGGVQRSVGIQIEKGYLKESASGTTSALTIRLFGEHGNVGSASIKDLSNPSAKRAIEKAKSTMKVSLPNPEFKGLVKPPNKYPDIQTEWDRDIENLTIDDTTDVIDRFLQEPARDKRIKSISGGLSYSDGRIIIINSNGIDLTDKTTSASIAIGYTMEEIINGKKENSSAYDGQEFIYFKEIHNVIDKLFDETYKKAERGIRKHKIETGKFPAVLSPRAVDVLITTPICSAIDAEKVYHNRSFLQYYLNQKIGVDFLTINDDPWLKGGLLTSPFDVEGTPTKPISIIKNGVLKSFLHNNYTANLFDTESTGHASRGWYSPSIGISSSNILLNTGDYTKEEMISEIQKGVYFDITYDHANLVTGEFSGMVSSGFLIEEGEIKNALRETMFGINLIDFFKKIKGFSKNRVRKESSYLPFALISDISFSGQ